MANTTTLMLTGLTPALIGAGLSFDVATVVKAWPSDAARTAGATPRFNAAKTGADTLPFTSPLYRYDASVGQVAGVLVGLEAVTLTFTCLTPELVGAGLAFDITATEAGSARILATLAASMVMDVHLLTEAAVYESAADRTADQNAIGRTRKRYSALPGTYSIAGALSFDLVSVVANDLPVTFEISRVLDGYESAAERQAADPASRAFTLEYNPGTNPPPYTAPAAALNEPGSPVIGSARMLSGAAATFDFSLRANGSTEGEESGEFTIRATVQPLSPGEAAAAADLTQGKQSVRIYTATRLKTVDEGQADRIVIQGRQFEVVACDPWQNTSLAHYKAIARAFNPMALP